MLILQENWDNNFFFCLPIGIKNNKKIIHLLRDYAESKGVEFVLHNVTEDVKQTYGLPIGVYIAQVFDGTPAQKVGLKKGDIIVSFDGETVETMEELTKLLDATPAGQEIEMQIMSSGFAGYEERTVTVVLEARY